MLIDLCPASEVGDRGEESTARAGSIRSALVMRMPLIMDIRGLGGVLLPPAGLPRRLLDSPYWRPLGLSRGILH